MISGLYVWWYGGRVINKELELREITNVLEDSLGFVNDKAFTLDISIEKVKLDLEWKIRFIINEA